MRTLLMDQPETAPVARARSFVEQKVGMFQRTLSLRVPSNKSSPSGSSLNFDQEIQKVKDMVQSVHAELKSDLNNQTKETDLQLVQFKIMHDNLKEMLELAMVDHQNNGTSDQLKLAMQKICKLEMDVSALKRYFDQRLTRKYKKMEDNTQECLLVLASLVDKELEKIQRLRESEKEDFERNMEMKMNDLVSKMVEQKVAELGLQSERSSTPNSSSNSTEGKVNSSLDICNRGNLEQPLQENPNQQSFDLDSEEEEFRKIEEEFRKIWVRARRNQVNGEAEGELAEWRSSIARNAPGRFSLHEGQLRNDRE